MFTPDEIRLLQKTLELREKIIDNRMKDNIPTSEKDINAATNLLESIDRSILARAKLKIDKDTNESNEQTKQVLREVLLSIHKGTVSVAQDTSQQSSIPTFKSTGITLNEGESVIGYDDVQIRSI